MSIPSWAKHYHDTIGEERQISDTIIAQLYALIYESQGVTRKATMQKKAFESEQATFMSS
jgi:hypothetical protein